MNTRNAHFEPGNDTPEITESQAPVHFGGVDQTRYGTKAYVDLPAPWEDDGEAKETFKGLSWDSTHRTFDGQSKKWECDLSALNMAVTHMIDNGYAVTVNKRVIDAFENHKGDRVFMPEYDPDHTVVDDSDFGPDRDDDDDDDEDPPYSVDFEDYDDLDDDMQAHVDAARDPEVKQGTTPDEADESDAERDLIAEQEAHAVVGGPDDDDNDDDLRTDGGQSPADAFRAELADLIAESDADPDAIAQALEDARREIAEADDARKEIAEEARLDARRDRAGERRL